MTAVFLHSFGGSAKSWDLIVPSLKCDALTPNLEGFGGEPVIGLLSIDLYVEDVLRIVERLDDYCLIGHSMGGKFAMEVAARQPSGLRGLILISTSPPTPEPMPDEMRQAMLEGYGNREFSEDALEQIVKRPIFDQVRNAAIEGYLQTSKAAYDWWLTSGSKENISASTNRVAVPVTLVAGTADDRLGSEAQRQITAPWFPGCSIYDSKGSGHLVPLEDPDLIIDLVNELAASS